MTTSLRLSPWGVKKRKFLAKAQFNALILRTISVQEAPRAATKHDRWPVSVRRNTVALMKAGVRKHQALHELADACARLAVAAGAAPSDAVCSMLTADAPLSTRSSLREQYEAVQRQAKRSNNVLIKRYNAAIRRANLLTDAGWPHIDPAIPPSEMTVNQRQECADAALNCARSISKCIRLLPDTVDHLSTRRRQILRRIEETNIALRGSIARLNHADSLLQSLIALRYLENPQAMSPAQRRRLHAKFIHALDSGEQAVADLVAATAQHAESDNKLTRNAIQIATLLGHGRADISLAVNHVVSERFLRRQTALAAAGVSHSEAALAEVRHCASTVSSTRIQLAQMRELAESWRENSSTLRPLIAERLS